jgi:four helix bundle protein
MPGNRHDRVNGYRDLFVFKKARELANETIRITDQFPKSEIYGSVSQMRRAAMSIPSNIAEGYRRNSRSDYIRFLRIAHGSCAELDAQLLVASDANWVDKSSSDRMENLINWVSILIWRLIESLKNP